MNKLAADEFRQLARRGDGPADAVLHIYRAGEAPKDLGDRKVRFCFSDKSVDLAGDVIDPEGWDLTKFRRNPVALFAHRSDEPPIGRASGVAVQGGKLMGDIEFADAATYPLADTIYRLVKGKFLNAVSVGFLPKKWSFTSDPARPYGIDFQKQILLEISLCPVPCNGNALAEARSKGIDTTTFDKYAAFATPRNERERIERRKIEARKISASIHARF